MHRHLVHPIRPNISLLTTNDGRNSFKIPTLKICSTARLNVVVLFGATFHWDRRIVMALSGSDQNGF